MPIQQNFVEHCPECGGHLDSEGEIMCKHAVSRCKSGDLTCPYRKQYRRNGENVGDMGEKFPAGLHETELCEVCGGPVCPHCRDTMPGNYTRRCSMQTVSGWPVCHMHGAGMPHERGTVGGPPNGRFALAGRYGYQFKNATLQESMEAALSSPELFDMRRELAVIETLLAEAIADMDTPQNAERWEAALKDLNDAEKAIAMGKGNLAGYHLGQLRKTLEAGRDAVANRQQVADLAMQKARMVEKERKYRLNEGLLMTPESQSAILEDVLRLLLDTVTDPRQINRFRHGLGALLRDRGYAVPVGDGKDTA